MQVPPGPASGGHYVFKKELGSEEEGIGDGKALVTICIPGKVCSQTFVGQEKGTVPSLGSQFSVLSLKLQIYK